MKVSIITPVHAKAVPFLAETYASLVAQTCPDWEWLLVPNHGGEIPPGILADPRVRAVAAPAALEGIGALKRFGFEQASGDVLVELDGDDLLTPDAVAAIAGAFAESAAVQFLYSNCCEFEHGTWKPHVYGAQYGWRTRPFAWHNRDCVELIAFPPTPHSLRRVYWAPNHVRVWRRSAYWEIGGHDPALRVGDDHDLLCRTYVRYGEAGFRHIDRTLYLYRVHPENSVKTYNAEIQQVTNGRNYPRYIFEMVCRWASDRGLLKVDLGGRIDPQPGFTTVDLAAADVVCDLNSGWDFDADSVGVLRASHILEHLRDPIHAMNEAYRVLAPGGWFFIELPSTDGRGAWQDPTHVSFWNENSFWYYTRDSHARYIRPQFKGRFQVAELYTTKSEIPFVRAHLICLKPPYDERPVGEVLIHG